MAALSCPLKVKVSSERFVAREHIGPILKMMVRVDYGKDCMMHVPLLISPGQVDKIKYQGLPVR